LQVIAEGVETRAQHALLLNNGCRRFQGHLFGRPMPVTEFERYCEEHLPGGHDDQRRG
jgi:EAL domain-containing protein (putative c-di-GMP-specific phosphodiesterase class I)